MKIFHKDIDEYEKEPEVKEDVEIIDDDKVDFEFVVNTQEKKDIIMSILTTVEKQGKSNFNDIFKTMAPGKLEVSLSELVEEGVLEEDIITRQSGTAYVNVNVYSIADGWFPKIHEYIVRQAVRSGDITEEDEKKMLQNYKRLF